MKKNNVVSGLIWSFGERFGAQIVSFVVSIVLARLLLPEVYGAIALVNIFINIADVFVTSGFGNSLIQKKSADQLDFSTVFFFNIAFSLFLYCCVFFSAPFIAEFYNNSELTIITRIMGLRLLLSGVNSVQRAYVSRTMKFKRFFYATLGGTVVSAVVGIIMAYKGYGVWALVAQYLTNTTIDTVVLWFTVKWRPTLQFSFSRLKTLLSYGWKLLASGLLTRVFYELNEFVIGKVYSSEDLAYYNKGKSFPSLFVTNINSAVETVLFPAMSREQNNIVALKKTVKLSITMGTFLVFPIVFGLAAIGNNLISVLLTDRWLESSKYLMIACISYSLVPIGMANLQAIKAIGRSDLYLILDIIKKVVGILLLIIFVRKGVIAIALAEAASNTIGFLLNSIPNKKQLGYSLLDQIKDVLPSLTIALIMFAVVYGENYLSINIYLKLFLQMVSGIIVYFGIAHICKVESLSRCRSIVSTYIHKK